MYSASGPAFTVNELKLEMSAHLNYLRFKRQMTQTIVDVVIIHQISSIIQPYSILRLSSDKALTIIIITACICRDKPITLFIYIQFTCVV